ncbi:restriction endonuclease subunit S [Bradyrhizobium sp. CCBAU 65884]|uniref:restriction endonuclease subunit S n=1 Tax=Bradyrhizobium sp. CCBAU 65884 TaxID=722477 RepID=UPI002306D4DC|nr:restriction endonuclease subunit S [Bradyrhizobium sp. CCBAU 65884]
MRDRLAAASLARLEFPDNDTFHDDACFVLENLAALTRRSDQIKRLRDTILMLAVRGRLVSQNPKDEVLTGSLIQRSKPRKVDDAEVTLKVNAAESASNRGQIPISWRWMTTDNLCESIVDCPHSTPVFVPNGVICLDTNSIKNGKLISYKVRYVSEATYFERVKRLVPRAGDVVFAREGSVGDSFIIPEGMRCCLGQRVMLFRPTTAVLPRYFSLALSEPSSLLRLLDLHKGIGAKHVNVSDMRKALIPLPPLAEQHRIVTKVDELMVFCDRLEASLSTAARTRRRLLDALLAEALAPAEDRKLEAAE